MGPPGGGSHHLCNTYPPEIWERVQALHWRQVLERKGHDLPGIESLVSTRFGSNAADTVKLIGMGIEFLFQKEILPELNARTKLRSGGFREVRFEGSKSRQAEIAGKWMAPVMSDIALVLRRPMDKSMVWIARLLIRRFGIRASAGNGNGGGRLSLLVTLGIIALGSGKSHHEVERRVLER